MGEQIIVKYSTYSHGHNGNSSAVPRPFRMFNVTKGDDDENHENPGKTTRVLCRRHCSGGYRARRRYGCNCRDARNNEEKQEIAAMQQMERPQYQATSMQVAAPQVTEPGTATVPE
jgi:hypothetical protein